MQYPTILLFYNNSLVTDHGLGSGVGLYVPTVQISTYQIRTHAIATFRKCARLLFGLKFVKKLLLGSGKGDNDIKI